MFYGCFPLFSYAADERRVEEESRMSADAAVPKLSQEYQRWLLEYGGWFNFRFTEFKNDDNDNSLTDSFDSSFSMDSRAWIKATLKPAPEAEHDRRHSFYLRLKNLYIERYGDSSVERYDNDGPHVDYAFAVLDFTPYRIEVGRRYFNVGRGIAYSNVNDGLQFNYFKPGWNFGGFVSHTLPHEDNLDASVPGFDKESDRIFYGLGAGYAGIKDNVFYGFALVQRDDSEERPNDPTQDYDYHSEYFGLGAKGRLVKRFDYWLELIRQTGQSRVPGTNAKADVDAYAANAGLQTNFNVVTQPRLTFEYAFGSGDEDRSDVTDTIGGNTGSKDSNFNYFGYMPTGIALAPRLSNLHMLRAGFDFKPMERLFLLRDMGVSLNYYYFRKDKSTGGISDLDATMADKDIGQEIDVEISYRIFSDLALSLEYGHFMPGDAFAEGTDDEEDYFSVSLTHSF